MPTFSMGLMRLWQRVSVLRARRNRSNLIGQKREEIVEKVLTKLKQTGRIRNFIRTSAPYSVSLVDLTDGIDFYVIWVGSTYKSISLSVTGSYWAKSHLAEHPESPVISVDLTDPRCREAVEQQILEILSAR